jgi:hypothetical protein
VKVVRTSLAIVLVGGSLIVLGTAAIALDCPGGTGALDANALFANVCAPGGPPGGSTSGSTNSGGVAGQSSGVSTASASSGSSSSGGSGAPNPYRWSREYLDGYSFPDDWVGPKSVPPDPNCEAENGTGNCTQYERGGIPIPQTCTGPAGQAGRPYRDTLTDTRTGEVVNSAEGCYVAGLSSPGPAGSAGGPAPPPPPPTAAEVIQASNLPRLRFGLSPAGKDCSVAGAVAAPVTPAPPCAVGEAPGLTGLETLLWIDPAPPPEVTVTVNIRGYAVTSRARPVRYNWRMRQDGDTDSTRNPNPIITTTSPGSEEAPAARYRWETKGDYRVSLAVVWQGSYTFSGFGVAPRTESLGPVTGQPEVAPYHVIEARSVPTAQTAP